jgi:hypothetical protein
MYACKSFTLFFCIPLFIKMATEVLTAGFFLMNQYNADVTDERLQYQITVHLFNMRPLLYKNWQYIHEHGEFIDEHRRHGWGMDLFYVVRICLTCLNKSSPTDPGSIE